MALATPVHDWFVSTKEGPREAALFYVLGARRSRA
jgi:hypothetical protein